MNSNLIIWQFVCFIASTLSGAFLHFLYDLTGQSMFTAVFSAVNESTWEHMKILFFPMFISAIIQSIFMKKKYQNFWCVKKKGILLGTALIPIMFYTYNGAFGPSGNLTNIFIFILSSAIAYIWETKQLTSKSSDCTSNTFAVIILCLVALLFAIFTFITPQIPLFLDPVCNSYGI